jgi:PAS domain S-box-containing protein
MLLNARQIEQAWGKERIILLAIEDVTERRRLEELLADSEERYRRLFETASDGIVLLEKNKGRIARTNPAAEKMLGYSEGESVGKALQDIGVPLDMSDFSATMDALDRNGILNYENIPVKTKQGQIIYTDIYMVDKAQLAQCNIRDVSERKLAGEILKEEKNFIEYALNSLLDIFLVFDLEGRFLRWNKATREVTGYLDSEIALMQPSDFFRDDDKRKITEAIQTTIREGSVRVYAQLVSKDGRQIPYSFNASLLSDAQGKPIGISSVGRDIADRKKLEAQLRQAQKMEAVGTLAGGIAHDFNNMLNVIMGYGGMVLDKLESGSPSKDDMNTLLVAAERAANLTKRLLVFSRNQVVDMKPVNINELILDLRKMLDRLIRESIELHVDLAASPLTVPADTGMLEQVLMNLVVNARDAMLEGGHLSICTGLMEMDDEYVRMNGYGKPGRYALISVTDTGQGIDAETQKRIFEPFFTTKGASEGTGLGLAISYGIIKQHNGYINVYSEPRHGTVFNIYLPLCEAVPTRERKTAAAVPVKCGNETVLLAEDDPPLRELARRMLEAYGYNVISAKDGEDAITKFLENREGISLLLLDMIMPKKNGREVAEAIRKVSPGIKILFVSGYIMDSTKTSELIESGFDFIHKPFQLKELAVKVREILDK